MAEPREASSAAWDYDYERMLDLAARIAGNGDQIDLSDRTAEGNRAAVALVGQIVADGIELRELLHARQSAIEAGPMTAAKSHRCCVERGAAERHGDARSRP